MLTSDNSGDIYIAKIDGEQVAIEKINPQQYKNMMVVWKNPLGDMTKHTTDFKNKVQELYNLLKNKYLPRKKGWTAFWGTFGESIKYVLPVTTL